VKSTGMKPDGIRMLVRAFFARQTVKNRRDERDGMGGTCQVFCHTRFLGHFVD
jgi:hypothetical protein